MAKKMGSNPLSGLNSLIRDTQADSQVPYTQEAQSTLVPHDIYDAHDVPPSQIAHNAPHTQEAHYAHDARNEYAVHNIYDAQEARHEYDITHGTDALETADTAPYMKTQGRKGQKLPRINMAFAPDNLAYLQAISGFERISATQYVNNLIREDKNKRQTLYEQLLALRGN